MRASLALVALFALAPLAGCVGPSPALPDPGEAPDLAVLSAARFDVLPVEIAWVASAADGKRLHNAVFRPDTDEPVPVFINFSPYWGDSAEAGGDGFARHMVAEFVPRGYAVVLSAVRGTGHSEGCFQIGGDQEVRDAYDVVDHFASQPWSNGRVGAGGKSYDSTTQNGLVAKMPHPALRTVFHVSGITDMYRYNYHNGVPYGQGTIFNTYYWFQGTDEYGLDPLARPPADADRLAEEDPESLARLLDDAACPEFPGMQAAGIGSGAHGAKTAYWRERDWNRYVADSEAVPSVFFVHGLQDWNVKPDHILPWLDLLPDHVVAKVWLHQWTRTPEGGHVYPMRADWNETMLRWLDHWLKGVDTGLLAEPLAEAQGTDGVWRTSARWPPGDGGVGRFMLREATRDEALVVAANETPLRWAGSPRLRIAALSVHADPVFTAILYDEAPNGTRTWLSEAVLRGVYRNGLDQPDPVMPNAAYEYTLSFYPGDVVLEAGHALVLAVGRDPRFAQPTEAQLAGIGYDLSLGSMDLPLAPLDAARPAQPTWVDCFAC